MTESYYARLRAIDKTAKDLWRECCNRGRKISYDTVLRSVHKGIEIMPKLRQKMEQTLAEMEDEHGKLR